MFARFVRPLLATILSVWEIWSPPCITLEKKITRTKKRITAPILKPTDDQKPETFFVALLLLLILNSNLNAGFCFSFVFSDDSDDDSDEVDDFDDDEEWE